MTNKINLTKNSDIPTITIGIPTYNRPEALCRRIAEINQFCSFVTKVLIYDNSQETSAMIVEAISTSIVKIEYVKNKVNVGAGANLLKILESTETSYLWWRGDDDVITEEQVQAVFSAITPSLKLILLNFNIKNICESKGLDSFINKFCETECCLWMSQVVVPVEYAKAVMSYGYDVIDWPHVVIILKILSKYQDTHFVMLPYTLRKGDFRDVGRLGQSWKFFNVSLVKFPETANAIQEKRLKKMFIRNWQKSKDIGLARKMVGVKLGVSTQESMNLKTFLPLFALSNIKSSALGVTLYIMAMIPDVIYKLSFSFMWKFWSTETKLSYNVDGLKITDSFSDVYKRLNSTLM